MAAGPGLAYTGSEDISCCQTHTLASPIKIFLKVKYHREPGLAPCSRVMVAQETPMTHFILVTVPQV